jgi:hypothetical protein
MPVGSLWFVKILALKHFGESTCVSVSGWLGGDAVEGAALGPKCSLQGDPTAYELGADCSRPCLVDTGSILPSLLLPMAGSGYRRNGLAASYLHFNEFAFLRRFWIGLPLCPKFIRPKRC